MSVLPTGLVGDRPARLVLHKLVTVGTIRVGAFRTVFAVIWRYCGSRNAHLRSNSNLATKVTQLSTTFVIPFTVSLGQIHFNTILLTIVIVWFFVVPVGELCRTSIRPNIAPLKVSIGKSNPHGGRIVGDCLLSDKILLFPVVDTNQIGSILLTTLLSLKPA
jgi:hypothetical protein